MVDPINQLGKLAIIQIDFDIWSGQVKLEGLDLKLGKGGELPSKKLVELGRKNVINRKHLNPFHRLKTQARRLLASHGLPFMSGFAVPLTAVDDVITHLDEISTQMDDLIDNFTTNYDGWVDNWVATNPEYSSVIRAGALTKDKVRSRLGFEYQVFQVDPVNDRESKKLDKQAAGLSTKLIDEVVKDANEFFANCIDNRDSCHANTCKTLKRMRDKVNGLSFLDNRFIHIVNLLDKGLEAYSQSNGKVAGAPFYKILATTLILSSQDKIEQYASGSLTLESMANKLDGRNVAEVNHEIAIDDDGEISNVVRVLVKDNGSIGDDMDSFFQSASAKNAVTF